jgi:hypothetical protein
MQSSRTCEPMSSILMRPHPSGQQKRAPRGEYGRVSNMQGSTTRWGTHWIQDPLDTSYQGTPTVHPNLPTNPSISTGQNDRSTYPSPPVSQCLKGASESARPPDYACYNCISLQHLQPPPPLLTTSPQTMTMPPVCQLPCARVGQQKSMIDEDIRESRDERDW